MLHLEDNRPYGDSYIRYNESSSLKERDVLRAVIAALQFKDWSKEERKRATNQL